MRRSGKDNRASNFSTENFNYPPCATPKCSCNERELLRICFREFSQVRKKKIRKANFRRNEPINFANFVVPKHLGRKKGKVRGIRFEARSRGLSSSDSLALSVRNAQRIEADYCLGCNFLPQTSFYPADVWKKPTFQVKSSH